MQKRLSKKEIEQINKIYSGWIEKLQLRGKNYNELLPTVIRCARRYLDIYEEWKNIRGYEGLYQVSNFGRVKSHKYKKERILISKLGTSNYLEVSLCINNSKKSYRIHQLVVMEFLNHMPNGSKIVVNHKNFIRKDNRLENLEIVTTRENTNLSHIKHSSKYTGVSWSKRSKIWISSIRVLGKLKYLGSFKNEIDASNAYNSYLKNIN